MSRPPKNKAPASDSRAPYDGSDDTTTNEDFAALVSWVESEKGVKLPLGGPEMNPAEIKALALYRQQKNLDRLRVDPLGDDPMAFVYAPIIQGRASEDHKKIVGELLVSILEKSNTSQLHATFLRIVALKRNAESPHRNSQAFLGYARFLEETDREPTKPELKSYLLARPDAYKGLPPGDDKKAWTRLWKDSGLFSLPGG